MENHASPDLARRAESGTHLSPGWASLDTVVQDDFLHAVVPLLLDWLQIRPGINPKAEAFASWFLRNEEKFRNGEGAQIA